MQRTVKQKRGESLSISVEQFLFLAEEEGEEEENEGGCGNCCCGGKSQSLNLACK